jgi:hypothetical protein
VQQIADWLGQLGLGQYSQRFAENEIDVSVLRHLTDRRMASLSCLHKHCTRSRPAARVRFDPPRPTRSRSAITSAWFIRSKHGNHRQPERQDAWRTPDIHRPHDPGPIERLRDHHDFETLVCQNHNWMVQTRRIEANLVVASVRTIFSDAGRRGSTPSASSCCASTRSRMHAGTAELLLCFLARHAPSNTESDRNADTAEPIERSSVGLSS